MLPAPAVLFLYFCFHSMSPFSKKRSRLLGRGARFKSCNHCEQISSHREDKHCNSLGLPAPSLRASDGPTVRPYLLEELAQTSQPAPQAEKLLRAHPAAGSAIVDTV